MKRRLVTLVAWSARVGGWALVLSLFGYVAWNHEGIAVRGQLARLGLAWERERALRVLLKRAGLEGRSCMAAEPPIVLASLYGGPVPILRRRPSVLHLTCERYRDPPPPELCVCFDTDGRVVGAPVELTWRGCWLRFFPDLPVTKVGLLHFLRLREDIQTVTTAPATGPTTVSVVFHVFRLGLPASVEVFAVRFTLGRNRFPGLGIAQDESGKVVLHLEVQTWTPGFLASPPPARTLATFTWDESRGRFVGPERDPQGQWEILPPPSEPLPQGSVEGPPAPSAP